MLDDIIIYILNKYNSLNEKEKEEQLKQYRDLIHNLITIHYDHTPRYVHNNFLYVYKGNVSDKYFKNNKIYCIQDLSQKITKYIDIKTVMSDNDRRYIIPGELGYVFEEYDNSITEAAIHNLYNDELV